MSPAAASTGSAERSTESEQTVYDTAATVETGEEMQEPASQAGDERQANAEGLQLGYSVVPSEKRFLVLHAFLKRKQSSKKVMVLFSSRSSVEFHAQLLNFLQIECADIHEKQEQLNRTAALSAFCTAQKGVLLCTNVAARGLDLPHVDYIVQYDPPADEPEDYIHHVGRTAPGDKGKATVLLFLLPQELEFLISLRAANIHLTEHQFNNKNVPNLQAHFEKIVGENYFLHQSAQQAYRSYILAYNSHTMKAIFKVHSLCLKDVAASFCFRNPPKVDIGLEGRAMKKVGYNRGLDSRERRKRRRINAANP
ncbi:unnamed protein product [Triticum turgidum subsp. durum]|uniref:ATP-dependent RNA helicase n=1 Tax=Triticum turgidum subsp. durum TaxID=4567 RepID=A0A9R1C0V4_TRITD|nr:unnamed protein product [Triticum turgidum subsp. durum]